MKATKKKLPAAAKPATVDDFMRQLDHPLTAEIEAVRSLILCADPAIAEGIKWSSLSFRTSEFFATVHLRSTDAVQLIFHLGAKVKDGSTAGVAIDDPKGLLTWLAKDRATVRLRDMKAIASNGAAFQDIVRQWVAHVR